MQHDFILLDRSQSMSEGGKWPEAIAGINNYVAKLAADNVDTGVTLAAFDRHEGEFSFAVLRDRIIPTTWKPVSNEDAVPRGWTPLNDAIGRIVSLADAGNYDKVAIIIVTDGAENSSKELTVTQAKELLQRCRTKGWQVIFLGADYDNAVQAMQYDNAPAATVQSTARNMAATFAATADKRGLYSRTGAAMAYSDEEKRRFGS